MFDEKLFEQISASKAPQKLLIVPAQLTLSAEQAAFDVLGHGRDDAGFFDLQIMSGNKLRHEISAKAGGPGRTIINTLGRSMILRKCAKESDLDVYSKLIQSQDFLAAAGDFIVQLKQSMCNLSDILPSTTDSASGDPSESAKPDAAEASDILSRKLSDMAKIYEKYEAFMSGKYMDSEDGLIFAAQQAGKCDYIKNSEIWFCGFYSFTKREQAFLKALDDASYGCHVILETPKEEFPDSLTKIYEAGSPNEQALFLASEILRLIREEKYNPEDIAILSGNIAVDGPCIRRSFEALGIPVYTDEKQSLMHMDAPAKIASLLDMCADGLRPQSVSIFAASEDLENYIRQYKVKGNAFLKPFKYGGDKKIEAEKARDEFANLVGPFLEEFKKADSVKEKTVTLYRFLAEKMQMPQAMHQSALELSAQGFNEASDETEQLWPIIVQIFDQAVELIGDEPVTAAEYRDIIKNAFKDIKIGLLPQKSGCIIIGDIYRTKLNHIKALFVASFNDSCIPRSNDARGILTEAEQRRLAKDGYVLCKPYEQLNKEDKACIYQAFASADEKLYLSYTLSDSSGDKQSPSYMLRGLDVGLIQKTPGELYSLESLIEKLRQYKNEGTELDDKWKAVSAKYKDTARYDAAIKGLLYRNEDIQLDARARDKLLRPALASASGLEKYARCPYSYFMQHGIRPELEKDFAIDKSTIGNIHHEALMRLSRWLSADGKPISGGLSRWTTVGDDEIKEFIDKAIDEIKARDSSGLLLRGPEEEYRTQRVKTMAQSFALQMVRQVRLGNIDIIKAEEEFSFSFAGTKLVGKIDRMDITSLEDKELVKIIDYKSGKTNFSKELIEKGLAIQLMLYMEVARNGRRPIGTFYFHIENPRDPVAIDDLAGAALEKLFKLDGAYVSDNLIYIDKTATGEKESQIVKKTQQLSSEEFEALSDAFRDKLSATIARLNSGDISVRPRSITTTETSCLYCPYNSVCSFDPSTEGFAIF